MRRVYRESAELRAHVREVEVFDFREYLPDVFVGFESFARRSAGYRESIP